MVRILEILLDRQGGITVGGPTRGGRKSRGKGKNKGSGGGRKNNTDDLPDDSDLPWLLREFELVDLLINQVRFRGLVVLWLSC